MIYGQGEIWDTFLSATAEFAGTAMLVFLGCGGCIGSMGVIPSHLQITLTFGLAVMIVIQVGTCNKVLGPFNDPPNYYSIVSH